MSTVSIIVPVYKGENFLESFVPRMNSMIIFPDETDFTFVLNDEEPESYSHKLLKSIDCKKQFLFVPREPVYCSWNRAIKESSGEYLCNFNIDDYHFPRAIQKQKEMLDENSEFDLAYGQFKIIHEPLTTGFFKGLCSDYYRYNTDYRVTELSYRHRVGPCPMWRRKIHDELGYFDESFKCSGDHHFWVKMLNAGKRFLYTTQLTCLYYDHENTITRKTNKGVNANLGHLEDDRIFVEFGEKWQ